MGPPSEPRHVLEALHQSAPKSNSRGWGGLLEFDLPYCGLCGTGGGRGGEGALRRRDRELSARPIQGFELHLVALADLPLAGHAQELPNGLLRGRPRRPHGIALLAGPGAARRGHDPMNDQRGRGPPRHGLQSDLVAVLQRRSRRGAFGRDCQLLPVADVAPSRSHVSALHVDGLLRSRRAQEHGAAARGRGGAARLEARCHSHSLGGDFVAQGHLGQRADAQPHGDHRRGALGLDAGLPDHRGLKARVAPRSHELLQVRAVVVVGHRPPEVGHQRLREELLPSEGQTLQAAARLRHRCDNAAGSDCDQLCILRDDRVGVRADLGAGDRRAIRSERELLPSLLMAGREEAAESRIAPLRIHRQVVLATAAARAQASSGGSRQQPRPRPRRKRHGDLHG
mmetsp:Transcript_29326/g.84277  ORF Transcript_29326/g.84277 Transcript_29326/m.84277 type:complete len:398 (-) Transcript_29326:2299-3492(-)